MEDVLVGDAMLTRPRVIEDALRAHLGIAALDEAQRVSMLSEDEALELANAEVHAARRDRRQ